MLVIEPFSLFESNKELTSVSVGTTVSHREETSLGVLSLEVLIGELRAINGFTTSTVFISEITTLDHEVLDETMEDTVLEVKGLALDAITLFTSTEGTEIVSSLGSNILEQFHFDSLGFFFTNLDIEENSRVGGIAEIKVILLLFFVVALTEETTPHLLLFFVGFLLLLGNSLQGVYKFGILGVEFLSLQDINLGFF